MNSTTAAWLDAHGLHARALELVESAAVEVCVAMFLFALDSSRPEARSLTLLDALVRAHVRGVTVRVVISPFELDDGRMINEVAGRLLRAEGVDVRTARPRSEAGGMHAKFVVADFERALVTSANFTGGGLGGNDECGLEVHDAGLADDLRRYFAALWDRGAIA